MSFNRLRYDPYAYELKMEASIDQGLYRLLNDSAENINKCFSPTGIVGVRSDTSYIEDKGLMADAESSLLGLNVKLNKSNVVSKLPEIKPRDKNSCSINNGPQDTRFTHPIDNYRSMNILNYHFTPFVHIYNNYIGNNKEHNGLNTRLYSRDTYIMPEHECWEDYTAFPPSKK